MGVNKIPLHSRASGLISLWERRLTRWEEEYGPDGWDGTPAPIAVLGQAINELKELINDREDESGTE